MSSLGTPPAGIFKRPNLPTRFVQNMREVGGAFLPGLFEIGKAGVGDIGRGIAEIGTLGRVDTDFKTPEIGRAMLTGFKEESFIPALFTGHPVEAAQRFSDRPFEGVLDLTGLVFGGARAAGGAGKAGAKAGVLPTGAARVSGYKPLTEIDNVPEQVKTLIESGDPEDVLPLIKEIGPSFTSGKFKYKTPEIIQGELWTRPIARRIELPESSVNQQLMGSEGYLGVFNRRSSNELAARMGDFLENQYTEHLGALPVVGNQARVARRHKINLLKRAFSGKDEWAIRHAQAVRDYEKDAVARWQDRGFGKDEARDMAHMMAVAKLDGINSFDELWENHTKAIEENNVRQRLQDAQGRYDLLQRDIEKQVNDIEAVDRGNVELRNQMKADLVRLRSRSDSALQDITTYRSFIDNATRNGTEAYNWVNAAPARWKRFEKLRHNVDAINDELGNDSVRVLYDTFAELDAEARQLYGKNHIITNANELNRGRNRIHRWAAGEYEDIAPAVRWSDGTESPVLFRSHRPDRPDSEYDYFEQRSPLIEDVDAPGNPLELYLKGKDRWDLDVYLEEYFKQHRLWSDSAFISDFFLRAPAFTMKQLQFMDEWKHIEIADMDGKTRTNKPFVAVAKHNAPAKRLEQIQTFLGRWIDELADLGDDASKEQAAALKRLTPQLDPDSGYVRMAGIEDLRDLPPSKRLEEMERLGALPYGEEMLYRIVPREVYDSIQNEAMRSTKMIERIMDRPTEVWKNLVLHLRPKWMVNNAVGSFLLLAMSEGFFDAVHKMFKISKSRQLAGEFIHGKDAWMKRMRKEGLIVQTRDGEMYLRDYVKRTSPEVFGDGSAAMYRDKKMEKLDTSTKAGRAYLRWKSLMNNIADFNAKWADNPARMAKAFAEIERRADNLKDIMRAKGGVDAVDEAGNAGIRIGDRIVTDEMLYQQMLDPRVSYSKSIRADVSDAVFNDMIDYQNLSPFERRWIRRMIPFWSWIKGATRVGAKNIHESPFAMWMMGEIGGVGVDAQTEAFGKSLPAFLRGVAVAPEWMQRRGIEGLQTGAMNPWQTPMDIASLVAWGVGSNIKPYGGENPIAMMNPAIKVPIEVLTGRDVFFGTPLPATGGGIAQMLQRGASTPLTNMLWNPFYGWSRDDRGNLRGAGTLFRPQSPRSTTEAMPWADVASYLGAPEPVNLRMGPVRKRAREERQEAIG